jgi:predicted TIM-barrel fold metal-dependent hydrolase
MIVDVHCHVFPPSMIERRLELARGDDAFAEMYGDEGARMATAEELLASMDTAGVDRSVAAGFAWQDPSHAAEHAEYLLVAAGGASGRLLPFVPLSFDAADANRLARDYATAGAAGFGELRIGSRDEDGALTALARAFEGIDLPLLAHVSEGVGHEYGGKTGGLTPRGLWRLVSEHRLRVIAAHWGGGFPFYALMPEVRDLLADGRLAFDSAASPLLYEPRVFELVSDLVGDTLVMWGSDYPLREQAADRAAAEQAIAAPERRAAALGGNAARFLRLS